MTRQNSGMLLTRPNRATFFSLYTGLAYCSTQVNIPPNSTLTQEFYFTLMASTVKVHLVLASDSPALYTICLTSWVS